MSKLSELSEQIGVINVEFEQKIILWETYDEMTDLENICDYMSYDIADQHIEERLETNITIETRDYGKIVINVSDVDPNSLEDEDFIYEKIMEQIENKW